MGHAVVPTKTMVAADNGCFTDPAGFSISKYERHLYKFDPRWTLFATAPDVLADHHATVEKSHSVLPMIRGLGLPAAFVAQDGWQENTTPWDDFDVLFVGGTTQFKFRGGRAAIAAAKNRGKRVHMGRVNSLDRLRAAVSIGCDSADGTFLRFGPDTNIPRLLHWLQELELQQEMRMQ
jgi:hypothetical protein